MMKVAELKEALKAAGWHVDLAVWRDGVPWYAWRRLDGATDCTSNEKPPSLILQPYEIEMNGTRYYSVEFDVCGEAGGRWLKLKAYSVPIAEALQAIPQCTALLRAAWNAAAAVPDESVR
jgi:hypothetical protein